MTETSTATSVPATPVRTWVAWAFLCILALVWGSSFILIKRSLEVFSSQQVAAGRILLAWLFFIPFLTHQSRQPEIRSSVKQRWVVLLAAGLLGNLIPAFMFAFAGAHLNSSLSGALNSLSPLFTLLIGAFFFGRKIPGRQLAGILLGLVGSVLLVFFSTTGSFTVNGYALLVVIATLCYGTNINLIGRYLGHMPSLVSTSWIFMAVGPLALLTLLPTDVLQRLQEPGVGRSLSALIVLGVLGSGVMTILFNRIVQLAGPVFGSSVTYLIPIVALGWGIVDGEAVYFTQYAGMGICLLGIYLTNK
nr:DMT family transporter [uncultured Arsenicibacter sp.]